MKVVQLTKGFSLGLAIASAVSTYAETNLQESPISVNAAFIQDKGLNQWVFVDSEQLKQMRVNNENSIIRSEEMKARGGSRTAHEYSMMQGQSDQNRDMAQQVFRAFVRKEGKAFSGLVREHQDNVALQTVGVAGAIYSGKTFRTRLNDSTRAQARVAARSRQASVGIERLGFIAHVGYSGTERHVTGSVSKTILPNIQAVVETGANQEFRLQYGVSF